MRTIAPDFSRTTTETEPSLTSTKPATSHVTLWNSPVPYLFGGLAAMLGLIVLTLLILACSYWKVSRQLLARDYERESRERMDDLERGKEKVGSEESVKPYGEQVLIIMAGDERPSFLATPVICAKISSFSGENSSTDCSKAHENEEKEKVAESSCEKIMKINDDERESSETSGFREGEGETSEVL